MSVEQTEAGLTIACKRATNPDAAPAIRDEAALLAEIDHPGVIRFVELREGPGGPTLVTEYVGPRTLATVGPVTTDRAAALIADLASTVADLHALGLVHGAVEPEHVLVAGDRTVLCGLAAGTGGRSPADDVHGVGTSLRALLDPDLEEEPIPDRLPWRRTPWQGYRHRALLTLADQATDDEPGRRPAARALADGVRDLSGASASPTPAAAASRSVSTLAQEVVDLMVLRLRGWRTTVAACRRLPPRAAALGGLGLAVVAVGMFGVAGAVAPSPTPPRTPLSTTSAATAADGRPCPDPDRPGVDVDGDGCPERVRTGRGWVEVDGRRYRVGRPGDDLLLGDWDGDGAATVALLRRPPGEVWRFAGWDPDATVVADYVGRYPGATGLERRGGPGHDLLLVRHRDGSVIEAPIG